jgi:hypothetical protein
MRHLLLLSAIYSLLTFSAGWRTIFLPNVVWHLFIRSGIEQHHGGPSCEFFVLDFPDNAGTALLFSVHIVNMRVPASAS